MAHLHRAIYRIRALEEGPGRARAIVDQELREVVSLQVLEKLELMVSELVTGGIALDGAPERGEIMLDLRVDSNVRCSVVTYGQAERASDTVSEPMADGWALRTVASLAERWGVRRRGESVQVWFETERE